MHLLQLPCDVVLSGDQLVLLLDDKQCKSPADAVPDLQHDHFEAELLQLLGGDQPRDASSVDDDFLPQRHRLCKTLKNTKVGTALTLEEQVNLL